MHRITKISLIIAALFLMACAAFAQSFPPCDVLQVPEHARQSFGSITTAPPGYTKTVSAYIETDHDIYVYCGNDTGKVRLFVNSWFEQWRKQYLQDSILVRIDSIGYWKTVEPYTWASSGALLADFGARMNTAQPTADYAHFVSIKNNGWGGISYVGGIGNKQFAVSFSHIYTAFYFVPNFSWTIYVLSHEAGHMLNSQHTHNCYWNWPDGHTGPIDSLYTCEGGCCVQTSTQSGTLMSYGHITSYGVDFNKGFGPLPKAAVKQYVWDCYNAGLLKNPNAGLCQPPYVTAINTTTITANIEWGANGTQYRFRFKQGANAWSNTVTTNLNIASIAGLISQKSYLVQVKSKVGGVWSAWSMSYKFKTK